ncbi:MAG TPA: hypothetical protein VFM14_04765 [Gemmatimonadales bacterium]|nr:hypothetical protein [Gemmatimonadales bacterium]
MTFALATAACGGSADATGPSGPGNPLPSQSKGTLVITNASSNGSGLFIRVRACNTSGSWSADLLSDPNNGAGAIMFGGETGSWQLDPGCNDVRVTPSEVGLDYFYAHGVQLTAGQTANVTIDAFPLEP